MKAVVAYDTHYGNTKMVAEAIVEELGIEGHEAELRGIRERRLGSPTGDILFVGSPVRFGSVTRKAKRYVEKLDRDSWSGKPIAVFTTTLKLPDDATVEQRRDQDQRDRRAGHTLREAATSKGLDPVETPLWVEVKGIKGPLVEDGVEKTRRFTRDVLRSVDGTR